MGQSQGFRETVERIVGEVLQEHMQGLKTDIVERACRELGEIVPPASPQPAAPAGGTPTDVLNAAFSALVGCSSQADILGALLAGAAKFAARTALFVIRGGIATGWRATGFSNDDAVKSATIGIGSGLVARAVQDRVPASAAAGEFDSSFIGEVGPPAEGTNVLVLPLVMKGKVAALLYADGGAQGPLDPSALECLVRSAGMWLEIIAARKTEPVDTASEPVEAAAPPPSPEPALREPDSVMAAPSHHAEAAAAAAAPAMAPVAVAADEEEIHKKAKRFAKLLVDEIKLYNKKKVEQGRAEKDVYSHLKDDIDKSRASYDKRYGRTAAASADYFNQELIRVLCDGDESLLGEGFSR